MLEEGSQGVFEVSYDGEIFAVKSEGVFPDEDTVIKDLKEKL